MTQLKTRFGKVSLALTGLALMTTATTAFAQGTLYVEQVGQTGSTTALSSAGTALYLDQYTTAGTLNSSMSLTTAGANVIVDSGTATSEGALTQSGNFLTFVGYDTAVGTAGVAAGSSPRGVGIYNISTGTVDDTTQLASATSYNGNNIRSATTTDGKTIYTSGTASSSQTATAGVRSTTDGATTSTAQETTYTNTRYVESYNGNVYFSTGTGLGIFELNGTATPTTIVADTTTGGTNLTSPYAFVFANGGTTLYVADSTDGIEKYTSTGGVFSSTPTETFNITGGGISGLTFGGTDSKGNNVLYAVDGLTGSSSLLSLDDTGSNAALTVLATAPTNTAFRGVAFVAAAPEASSVVAMAIGISALGLLVARRRFAVK